jgi:F-box protein 18 (helicase)
MIKVARAGKVIGDFEPVHVIKGLKSGELLYTDHYWQQGASEWKLLMLFELPKGVKGKTKASSEKIKPTAEQEVVARSIVEKGQVMLINAYAGSGKTETLRLIAERHPEMKFTYLCYNKDTAEKAKKRFPSNASCRTIHSLAFAAVGRYFKKDFRVPSAKEVMLKFKVKQPFVAVLAIEAVVAYCNSDKDEIGEEHFGERRKHGGYVLNKYPDLIDLAKSIWAEMINHASPFPISHDGYLKLWSMNAPSLPGDVILHDESQDMNPVTLKILKEQSARSNPGLVIVGDSNQAIYGWRGAVNTMELLKPMAEFHHSLTTSFRFGQKIADNASKVLRVLKSDGNRIIGAGPTSAAIPESAYIGRRNSSLIGLAIGQMKANSDLKFHFAGTRIEANWDPYYLYEFQKPLDLLSLYKGRPEMVVLEQMKKFESYDEVVALVKGDDEGDGVDRELEWFIKNLLDPYKDELPQLIEALRASSVSPDKADLSLSTAHRSKGLEWKNVTMLDDFWKPREVTKDLPLDEEEVEEVNAIYVAMTRASETIEYGPSLREWLERMEAVGE